MKPGSTTIAIGRLSMAAVLTSILTLSTTAQNLGTPVSVIKEPIAVQTRYFADHASAAKPRTPHTDWQFRCRPQITYDIIENKSDGAGRHSVTIKIKGVSMKLTLPIVMRIAKTEARSTVEHELGHVQICRHVYDDADRLMRTYAQNMLGGVSCGSGQTVDEACAAALKTPLNKLSRYFISITNDKAKRISQSYDKLDATTKLPIETQVKLAEKKEAAAIARP